jgi:hypothetical protein
MTTVIEVEGNGMTVVVTKDEKGVYTVTTDGVVRHTPCSAEDVMRAMANYLHNALYLLEKK